MTDLPGSADDREVQAAGLALGLLDGAERSEALRLQLSDPEFAKIVAKWVDQGDRWLEAQQDDMPPPDLLSRIEARLDRDAVSAERIPDGSPSLPANAPVSSGTKWQITALLSLAASLLLAIALGSMLFRSSGRNHVNVAQIEDEKGAPVLSALYSPESGTLSLKISALEDSNLAPELWVIPKGGSPQSLGLLNRSQLTISLSPKLRELLVEGATMAVTLEPRKGAPHSAPSGPIIGSATLDTVQIPTT